MDEIWTFYLLNQLVGATSKIRLIQKHEIPTIAILLNTTYVSRVSDLNLVVKYKDYQPPNRSIMKYL
jgi:hypothetical protein